MAEEIEAKIPVPDLEPIRAALRRLGAEPRGRVVEENRLFDRPSGELRARGEVLRLRRADGVWLTWKGPASYADGVKTRREAEVAVSDWDEALELLQGLGFVNTLTYVTNRERWQLGAVEVSLDELAFGRFVELEGPREEIERVARLLGLDLRAATSETYAELQRAYDLAHADAQRQIPRCDA